MRYKNIIIKCKNNQEFIELQRYLFKMKYSWFDYGNKNRQIKQSYNGSRSFNESRSFCALIQNDDRIRVPISPEEFDLYKIVDFKQLIRKEKLKKINNV